MDDDTQQAAPVRQFDAPQQSLGSLDAKAAGELIAAAVDVALIIDEHGVIRDMAFGSEDLSREGHSSWLGKRWIDTVTDESRPKIEALLRDAESQGAQRWRQVNHHTRGGPDIPLLYAAVRFGREVRASVTTGRTIAFGRDMRAAAVLQQRLVDAQQLMERDYSRFRQAETRYRQLFQISSEAVLIVDATNHKVTEANPAARALLGDTVNKMVGSLMPSLFDPASAVGVQTLLAGVRAAGRDDQVLAQLPEGRGEVTVFASVFRLETGLFLLVRLARSTGAGTAPAAPAPGSMLQLLANQAADAMVVTDASGRVLSANRAFVELVQLLREDQVQGNSLDRWLGRTGVDLSVLLSNLRQGAAVRLYASTLRGEYGTATDVEVSAVAMPDSAPPSLGFVIRDVARRLPGDNVKDAARELAPSIGQLRELVGRAPLKDIVGKTNDLIEQMCIEAALELTRDNRASAAEMLGLSRQSLYVKLRRYGLSDRGTDGDV
jgi:transcriptional regulator PpsR